MNELTERKLMQKLEDDLREFRGLRVKIVSDVLTDGSKAFGVLLSYGPSAIKLDCVTEDDAEALSAGMALLLNSHTNLEVNEE